MLHWCRPGEKALCVKDGPWVNASDPRFASVLYPETGTVYTIRDVEGGVGGSFDDLFLRLEEIRNAPLLFGGRPIEPLFFVGHFRPLPRLGALRNLLLAPSPELEDA